MVRNIIERLNAEAEAAQRQYLESAERTGETADDATGEADAGVAEPSQPDDDATNAPAENFSAGEETYQRAPYESSKDDSLRVDDAQLHALVKRMVAEETAAWQSQLREVQGAILARVDSLISARLSQAAKIDISDSPLKVEPTADDVDYFGEEQAKAIAALITRMAPAIVDHAVAKLSPALTEVKVMAAKTQQTAAANTVIALLDSKVPNWREINASEEWKAWLLRPDPISGTVRNDLLQAHFAAGDAQKCLAILEAFLAENAAKKGQKRPLSTLAGPGRPAQSAAVESDSASRIDPNLFESRNQQIIQMELRANTPEQRKKAADMRRALDRDMQAFLAQQNKVQRRPVGG